MLTKPQPLVMQLATVLRELLDDEWRCTIDWGPKDEREAIKERANKVLAEYDKLRASMHR